MSLSVLAALRDFNCGRDLIYLSAILGVLNTTAVLKSLPQNLKSPDGDFMTLLNIMDEILLVKQSTPPQQFNLDVVCQAKGLRDIQHVIKQALRRCTNLEKTFNLLAEYRERAQVKSGNWELIARALLVGYYDNVFVSMKDLHDRHLLFSRYNGRGDPAMIDLQSTLTRPINTAPVSLVLARDIRHSTSIRASAILSFVGELKSEWIEYKTTREVAVTNEEYTYLNGGNRYSSAQAKFSSRIAMQLSNSMLTLTGTAGSVLNAELHVRQQMIAEFKFNLEPPPGATTHENFTRNIKSVMKMTQIFNPMKWRWQAQKQVEITVNSITTTGACEIIVKGRDSENRKVKKEFDSFAGWLQNCAVIRHPNDGKWIVGFW